METVELEIVELKGAEAQKLIDLAKGTKNFIPFPDVEGSYGRYRLLPEWITGKPLCAESVLYNDYEGNEAVYDWMIKQNIGCCSICDSHFYRCVEVAYDC